MLNILNLGAGVQSTTVFRMSCRGELPRLDCAIFADTQWEPRAVYEHLAILEAEGKAAGIPIHRVTAGNLRDDMLAWKSRRAEKSRRARMPLFLLSPDGRRGIINRQCTSDYKIDPIERFVKTEILGLKPRDRWPKEQVVRQWFGISADEFRRAAPAARRKTAQVQCGPNLLGEPVFREHTVSREIAWKSHCYPLCDTEFVGLDRRLMGTRLMDRQACLDWHAGKQLPCPPRSACIGCPFHSDAEWRRIKESPEEWADAIQFDEAIRDYDHSNAGGPEFDRLRGLCFLHADRVPLEEVVLTENDMPMFQCGNGICGV